MVYDSRYNTLYTISISKSILTLYLPYKVVDFPFHDVRTRKNGKNTLIKTRPRPKGATRGRKIPAMLRGS